jgi:hypothetical protein
MRKFYGEGAGRIVRRPGYLGRKEAGAALEFKEHLYTYAAAKKSPISGWPLYSR